MWKCSICGRENNDDGRFCSYCGTAKPEEKVVETVNEPVRNNNVTNEITATREGSYTLGFVLGFFLGLIGLLIALLALKEPKTTKACLITYVICTVVGILSSVVVLIVYFSFLVGGLVY